MTITSSGVMCDVCKEYILPGFSESVNPFSIKGIKGTLHCHDDCKPKVLNALKEKDWKLLSEGGKDGINGTEIKRGAKKKT